MSVVRVPRERLSVVERSVVAIGEHLSAWGSARAERRAPTRNHEAHLRARENEAFLRAREDADAIRRAQVWARMVP